MTQTDVRNIALAALVTTCAVHYIVSLDNVRTNRELREMAIDVRRANGYLVRQEVLRRERRKFWRR